MLMGTSDRTIGGRNKLSGGALSRSPEESSKRDPKQIEGVESLSRARPIENFSRTYQLDQLLLSDYGPTKSHLYTTTSSKFK